MVESATILLPEVAPRVIDAGAPAAVNETVVDTAVELGEVDAAVTESAVQTIML